ncbi:MAG TPA: hypothetical protein VGO11_19585 [Chthoniobacteraceae bacterium]|jgi:hypothetical protein|nr:hypothetical protein [Chthoniobacteraceae bacterium]
MSSHVKVELDLGYGNFLKGIHNVSESIEHLEHKFDHFAKGFAGFAVAGEVVHEAFELVAGQAERMYQALEMGSAFQNLSAQTGQSVGDLVLLKQAFVNAGLGGEAVGTSLALLGRALTGLNERGEPTKQAFDKLGLSVEALKSMTAVEQITTLQGAFTALPNPADRSRAAMDLFGRSGAQMLAILGNSEALAIARGQVGSLGTELEKNAETFHELGSAIGAATLKIDQFYVGLTGQAAKDGKLTFIQDLAKVDLTPLGRTTEQVFEKASRLATLFGDISQNGAVQLGQLGVGFVKGIAHGTSREAALNEVAGASEAGIGAATAQAESVATEKEREQALKSLEHQAEEIEEQLKAVEANKDNLFDAHALEEITGKYHAWAAGIEAIKEALEHLSPELMADRKAKRDADLQAAESAKKAAEMRKEAQKAGEDLERDRAKAGYDDRDPEVKRANILQASGAGSEEELDALIAQKLAQNEAVQLSEKELTHLAEMIQLRRELFNVDKTRTEELRKQADYAADQAEEMRILRAKAAGDARGQSLAERDKAISELSRKNEEMGQNPFDADKNATDQVDLERGAKKREAETSFDREIARARALASGDTEEAKRLEIEGKRSDKEKELLRAGVDPATAAAKSKELADLEAAQTKDKKGGGSGDADRRIGASNLAAGGTASPLLRENQRQTSELKKNNALLEQVKTVLSTAKGATLNISGGAVFQ